MQEQVEKLNDDLLVEAPDTDDLEEPKRNSKDDLVAKIINVCADNQLELE